MPAAPPPPTTIVSAARKHSAMSSRRLQSLFFLFTHISRIIDLFCTRLRMVVSLQRVRSVTMIAIHVSTMMLCPPPPRVRERLVRWTAPSITLRSSTSELTHSVSSSSSVITVRPDSGLPFGFEKTSPTVFEMHVGFATPPSLLKIILLHCSPRSLASSVSRPLQPESHCHASQLNAELPALVLTGGISHL